MASGRFLVWTAVSCAVGVGLCTWLAAGSSNGVRAVAALIGLGIGLLVVFLVAWAMPGEAPRAPVTPIAHEPVVLAPSSSPLPPPPPPAPAAPDLQARLEEGRALEPHREVVDGWIAETKRSLAQHRPGALGYFEALGTKTFADDRARLDAHLARLENIVHG